MGQNWNFIQLDNRYCYIHREIGLCCQSGWYYFEPFFAISMKPLMINWLVVAALALVAYIQCFWLGQNCYWSSGPIDQES